MRHPNRVPRDHRSIAQRAAMLAGAFVFVGVLAALVVGPSRAIYWAGNLILVVVIESSWWSERSSSWRGRVERSSTAGTNRPRRPSDHPLKARASLQRLP